MNSKFLRCAAIGMICAHNVVHATEYEITYDHVDVSGWNCYLCEFENLAQPTKGLRVRSLTVRDSSTHFGRESGFDNAGTYPIVDYQFRTEIDEDLSFTSRSIGIGMQARSFESSIEKAGSWGLSLKSRNQPQNFNRSGRSPYRQTDNLLSLDPDWVPSYSTEGFSALENVSDSIYIRKQRSQLQTSAWFRLLAKLTARIELTKLTQEGLRETYRDDLYASTALPLAYNNETDLRTLQLIYDTDRLQSQLHLRDTKFRSARPYFEWESPYLEQNRLRISATPPSTNSRHLKLRSRIALTKASSIRLNLIQDDRAQTSGVLLPYTTNRDLNTDALTLKTSSIHVAGRGIALAYVQRISKSLSIESSVSQMKRNDLRPETELIPAIGDSFLSDEVVLRSLDLTRRDMHVQVRSRFGVSNLLDFGLRRGSVSRTNQEVLENIDRTWWLNIVSPINSKLNLSASYEQSYRDSSEFMLQTLNNPATRRFHAAQRQSQIWNLSLDFEISPRFSAVFGTTSNSSDYPDTEVGLNLASSQHRFVQLKYVKPNSSSLHVSHGTMSQSHANSGDDWSEFGRWTYLSNGNLSASEAYLKLHDVMASKFSVAFNWQRLEDVTLEASKNMQETSQFPKVRSKTSKASLEIKYASSQHSQLSMQVLRQSVLMRDWQYEGILPRSIPNVLSLGRQLPDYTMLMLSVAWEREF